MFERPNQEAPQEKPIEINVGKGTAKLSQAEMEAHKKVEERRRKLEAGAQNKRVIENLDKPPGEEKERKVA
ncbi:MAG: hypothetical protein AAB617_01815 [Patescibacteria group bacterium]